VAPHPGDLGEELLRAGVECLLAGDLDTGKAILRDYINATIGFEKLSRLTGRPAKSLMRMLGRVEGLLRLGALGQLARGYREHPEMYEAEALCVIGLGLERSGDRTGAMGLWKLAAARDPRNPWPLRAAGRLLMEDRRVSDAQLCLRRAEELEAAEPRRVRVSA
jgi:hypothetical protein